ncbi:MAG TPA: PKD domain-containing protein [Burkholderiaceae bacterium]|nr:PKD domain-containing protein [Burkholderiaceae bacterium]
MMISHAFKTNTNRAAALVALTLGLAACGGGGSGAPDNQAPEARLTGPQDTILTGEPIPLDGRNSTDADKDPLSYEWALTTKPAGSAATLGEATGLAGLRFLMPDVAGRYDVSLRVTDGKGGESRLIRSLEVQAAPPPGIVMTESEPVSGLVHLGLNRATVSTDVQWYCDGLGLNAQGQSRPLSMEWETGFLVDGPHLVQAKLHYADGSQRTLERTVTVLNPTVKLTRPYAESYTGRTGVYVEAQSVHGIERVSLSFHGTLLGELTERNDCGLEVCRGAPSGYGFTVLTTQTGAGSVTLDLTARDKAGNSRTVPVTVSMRL